MKLDLSWWREHKQRKSDLKKLNIIKEKMKNKIEGLKEYIEYNKTKYKWVNINNKKMGKRVRNICK